MKKNNQSKFNENKKLLTEEEINSREFDPEDFAPAPDEVQISEVSENIENRRNTLAFAFLVALFTMIIGFAAWTASFVVTAYEDNLAKKQVLSCYENCDKVIEYDVHNEKYDIYAVFYKDKMAGYCVSDTVDGFGGKITIYVAFNSENKIMNIKIPEHNESVGLGSKIAGKDFLSQFYGVLVGNTKPEYDIIAGATTSSNAVGNCIKEILGLGLSTDSIAKELGHETITEDEIKEEIKKEEENKKPSSDKKDPVVTTDDKNSNLGGYQGGQNSNQGSGNVNIDGDDITTVYDTETEASESDETTAPDTTKKEEETTKSPETTESPSEDTTTAAEEEITTNDTTVAEDETTVKDSEDTTASDTTAEETTGPESTEEAVPVDNSQSSVEEG